MICGLEIGLAIFGLLALVRGKITISKTKVVVGIPARLIGLIALTPMPLAFGILAVIGVAKVAQGANPEKVAEDNQALFIGVEVGIVIITAIIVFGLGAALGVSPQEAERRERKGRYDDDYEDDDYEDDRPRRRDRDDEEEDERPRRRREEDSYEDEERPRRRRNDHDEDDHDPKNRR